MAGLKTIVNTVLFGILCVQGVHAQNTVVDTLRYPQAKASRILDVVMNVPSEFSGYSQYYATPQQVTVKGFLVYMGVKSFVSTDTAIVSGYLTSTNPDSSIADVLQQQDFTVYNTYDLSNIDAMAYTVMFDTPQTVSDGFHISLRTETTKPLGILANDHLNNDGKGEELAYWHWTADSTWYKSSHFFKWDIDYFIMPIVSYTVPGPLVNIDIGCNGDASCVTLQTENTLLNHPMYSQLVFDGESAKESATFTWGDGITSSFPDTCYVYDPLESYEMVTKLYTGWGSMKALSDTIEIKASASIDTHIACDSYTWIDGNTYTSNNNSAIHLIPRAEGCDSTVRLNLTINAVSFELASIATSIEVVATDATYQWLDCNNGQAPIEGQTGHIFEVLEKGSYAVAVTQNACTKISDCIIYNVVGISENEGLNQINIFPNPNHGLVNIDFGTLEHVSIHVVDANGKTIYAKDNLYVSTHQFELPVGPGIYFIAITTDDRHTNHYKLIR